MSTLFPGSEPFGSSTPLTEDAVSRPTAPARDDEAGFFEGVGAGIMNETELGAGLDALRRTTAPTANPDYDFNPFEYSRSIADPDRRALAEKLGAEGAFDRVRGEYHTPTDVENLIDQYAREDERRMIAGQSTTGYIGGSFLSLSTAMPFVGIGAKGASVARAATIGAASTGAVVGGLEGALQGSQVSRDPHTSYMAIGISTVLGGGIGTFGQLLTNGALKRKVAGAVDPNVADDMLAPNRSMGAAANPGAVNRAANEGDLGKTYGGWYDHLPLYAWTPVAATYKMADKGVNVGADIMRKMGINVPGGSHAAGKVERESVEDMADIEYTTHAQDAEAAHYAAQSEFRKANPNVSVDEFNRAVSLLHEFPNHTTGNAALDAAARKSVDADRGSRSFFTKMYEHMNQYGVFPTNKVAKFEADLEKAKADLTLAQAAATTTKSGKARKPNTKVAEQKQRVVDRLNRKIAKIKKGDADRRNYFTQAWNKGGLMAHGDAVKALLVREFSTTAATTDDMVERAVRALAPDDPTRPGYKVPAVTDDILDALDAFESGGFDALPDAVKAHLRDQGIKYATQEVNELVSQMINRGASRGVGMMDNDIAASGRVQGRKLHLSKEASEELMRLGVLDSDPVRVVRAYNADMGPRLAMHRIFGASDQNGLDDIIRQGTDDIDLAVTEGRMTQAEANEMKQFVFGIGPDKTKGQFQVMFDRVMNRSGYDDAGDGTLAWIGSSAIKYNFVARLGGMAISAVTDLATASVQAGLTKTPSLLAAFTKNLISQNLKNIQQIPNRELRQLLVGIENYNAFNGRAAQLGGAMVDPTRAAGIGFGKKRQITGAIERGSNKVSEVFTEATGMGQWNRALKHTASTMLLTKMHDIGSGLATMTPRQVEDFARWGVSKSDLEWIAKNHADDIGGIKYPNPDKWPKTEKAAAMRMKFFTAMRRAGDEAVVTVRKGDKPGWMDSMTGRLIGQFTSFSYAWTNRTGRRNLKQGILPRDAEAWSWLGQTLAYGTVAFMIKETIKGNDLPDPSSPDGLVQYIYEGIDRGGLLMQLTAPVNALTKLASSAGVPFLPRASRFESRNALNAAFGPTLGLAGDALEFTYGFGDAEEGEQLKKAIRLAPFNNVFYIDALVRRTVLAK